MVAQAKRERKLRLDCDFDPPQCPEPGNPWGGEASFRLVLWDISHPLAVIYDVCAVGETGGRKQQLNTLRLWAKSKGLLGHGPVAWEYTLKEAEKTGKTVHVSQWINQ